MKYIKLPRIDKIEVLTHRLNTKTSDHVRCFKCNKLGKELETSHGLVYSKTSWWICDECQKNPYKK